MTDIVMYFFTGEDFGMGHWYRSKLLAGQLVSRGNSVAIAGNRDPHIEGVKFYRVQFDNEDDFMDVVTKESPSVVVSDIPNTTPKFLFGECFRLVSIDGVGCPANGGLTISQGIDGNHKHEAPEHLIIDDKFFSLLHEKKSYDWFVFGGYYDKMNLASVFMSAGKKDRSCVVSDKRWRCVRHDIYSQPVDTSALMKMSNRAVVAMGMTVWELLAAGIKPHVFSFTQRHLDTALLMDSRGWVNAYKGVGIPDKDEFDAFLESGSSVLSKAVVDGAGTDKVMRLIEGLI